MSLFSDLGTLESAGLIRVLKMEPDLEYHFTHTMVQDAAYASLLESDRKRLHLAVGESIEDLFPERQKELAAFLGYHFREAGQDDKALYYFLIAGDEALASYANEEAEIQYRQSLALMCCSDEHIARLYSGLGEALYRQSRFDEAIEAFHTGIKIYQSMGNSDGTARLYARIGRIAWYKGDRPEGLRVCLEGLEQVKDAPDSIGKAFLLHETARAYHFNGQTDKALPLCQNALKLGEQLGDLYLQADSLATLGILSNMTPGESLDALRRSVDLAESNGMLEVAMRAHQNLGTMVRGWLGDNQAALDHFHRSAELGRMRGVASEEMLGLLSYISCLIMPGRIKEVEQELPHLEELVGRISNPEPMQCTIKFMRGVLVGFKGDWKTAITIYRECLDTWRTQKNMESLMNMINELAWILLEQNRWGEPVDLAEVDALLMEATGQADECALGEWFWVYPQISVLRARQGRLEEARQWLDKSRLATADKPTPWNDIFQMECEAEIATAERDWTKALAAIEKLASAEQRMGFRVSWARRLLGWADLLIQRGKPADMEAAQALLRQSLAEFIDIGVGYYPDLIQDRLKVISSRTQAQALDHEQMQRELKKARQVQESLLPEKLPSIPGWDMEAVLEPAHETSGDFYDFMPMEDGKMGFVIADVTDKGTSAALYMALSRSLWRTFAGEHPHEPELTMTETNRRILADSHGGLFITLFYGILDPVSGVFTYCNAGHHPAILRRARDGSLETLERTGMPLGAFEEASWSQRSLQIEEGDTLVLYTDGITDAQNAEDQPYGMEHLREIIGHQAGKPARVVHKRILSSVHEWVGDAQKFDDITLLVIAREKGKAHI